MISDASTGIAPNIPYGPNWPLSPLAAYTIIKRSSSTDPTEAGTSSSQTQLNSWSERFIKYALTPNDVRLRTELQTSTIYSALSSEAQNHDVEQDLNNAFASAQHEDFEDGIESAFSQELRRLVFQHGLRAMSEISYLIIYAKLNQEIKFEALRCLGRLKDDTTRSWRLWLLEKNLASSSAAVRDGALLGLAFIADPDAIPAIQSAIDREHCEELREDMKQILEELKDIAVTTTHHKQA